MYVLDTYALVEIKKGNPSYMVLLSKPFVIPDSTIAEFYSVVMRDEGEEEARFWYKQLVFYCAPIEKEIMIKGLKFRTENKKDNLSLFDAWGYVFARERNYLFVTGDKAFKQRDGVLFIPGRSYDK